MRISITYEGEPGHEYATSREVALARAATPGLFQDGLNVLIRSEWTGEKWLTVLDDFRNWLVQSG